MSNLVPSAANRFDLEIRKMQSYSVDALVYFNTYDAQLKKRHVTDLLNQ